MTKLSVNINKIATLRNARGGDLPSVTEAAVKIQKYGAHGITIHPRPDQRHITRQDVFDLQDLVTTEFNIEGYPSEDFIKMVQSVTPQQVTLVPDPPEVLTSNAGWKVKESYSLLKSVMAQLKELRVSVFVEPQTCSLEDLQQLKDLGVARIEMYTEDYAQAFLHSDPAYLNATIESYQRLYTEALNVGLEINAGHDLNQANLGLFIKNFPKVSEVSIGHALISEALYEGMETTVSNYLKVLQSAN